MNRPRFLVLSLAVGLALVLGGCGTPSVLSAVGVSPATQATVHLKAGQTLATTYDALAFAVTVAEAARSSGYFAGHPGSEAAAADAIGRARQVLDHAKAAYDASASNDPSSAIATAQELIAAAKAAAGK